MTAAAFRRQCDELPIARGVPWRRPLVVAPHPDDESLGCGGMLARCADGGAVAAVVIVSDGAGSHPNSTAWPPARLAALRASETRAAATLLGLPDGALRFLELPDTRVPAEGEAGFDGLVTRLIGTAQNAACDVVVGPFEEDPHRDHKAAAQAGRRAAAELRLPFYAYPIWALALADADCVGREALVGLRLEIADELPRKRAAIRCHASQLGSVVLDDPAGFRLTPKTLALFERGHETFFLESR